MWSWSNCSQLAVSVTKRAGNFPLPQRSMLKGEACHWTAVRSFSMDIPCICTRRNVCLGEANDQNATSKRNETKTNISCTEGFCGFNNILENAESNGLGDGL